MWEHCDWSLTLSQIMHCTHRKTCDFVVRWNLQCVAFRQVFRPRAQSNLQALHRDYMFYFCRWKAPIWPICSREKGQLKEGLKNKVDSSNQNGLFFCMTLLHSSQWQQQGKQFILAFWDGVRHARDHFISPNRVRSKQQHFELTWGKHPIEHHANGQHCVVHNEPYTPQIQSMAHQTAACHKQGLKSLVWLSLN